MIRFLRTLRGKLILTYTLVTVLALLALEVLALIVVFAVLSLSSSDLGPYLQDVIAVLPVAARQYLKPGSVDSAGLQSWLEETYASGKASLDPQDWADSPAAKIAPDAPMYVLSPEGIVLAQAPPGGSRLVGRPYASPYGPASQAVLDHAFAKQQSFAGLSMLTPDGNYFMAVPVLEAREKPEINSQEERALLGVVIVTVRPPPARLTTLWPVMLGTVLATILVTGLLLLAAVAPFGALFGFIMSRGLTRRLKALAAAADAWSEGDFSLQPQDRSPDEIGVLGMRLRRMAERIQALLQAQHELALLQERNRLARELHDTVKQQTFATLMQVRAAKNLLEKDHAAAARQLAEAEGLLKTSQQELGLMIAELRPAALEGQGLAGALRSYLDTWAKHACIPADFQVRNERRLPLEVEQALYRVAQEALANAARHSRATRALVSLAYDPDRVCLEVSDNGVGFDPRAPDRPGYGLQSMRERVEALGGRLTIESGADLGTRVVADINI